MPLLGVVLLLTASLFAGACDNEAPERAARLTGGQPDRGRDLLRTYGCQSCHTIPGVTGANGLVGPPLTRIASRVYVAGHLPNTPENLMRWIRHPRQVSADTAMPDTGVTEKDARHIAAYLYTLR